MSVRLARPEDAERIARIHVDTWRDAYAGLLPDRVLLRMSTRCEQGGWTGAILGEERVFVAERPEDGVVGFGSCGPNRSPNLGCDGEIYTLYVAPGFQGFGLGKYLVLNMLDEMHRYRNKDALVWVLRDNPARFFYEAIGAKHLAAKDERLWGEVVPQLAYRWELPHGEP